MRANDVTSHGIFLLQWPMWSRKLPFFKEQRSSFISPPELTDTTNEITAVHQRRF